MNDSMTLSRLSRRSLRTFRTHLKTLGIGVLLAGDVQAQAIQIDPLVTQLSAGRAHTCALTADGPAKCWGYNLYGQLGNGSIRNSSTPTDVLLASGLVKQVISAGDFHTCAVAGSGASCWGWNIYGQLGIGVLSPGDTPQPGPVPRPVSTLESGVASIASGDSFTCALTAAGGVKCWGSNGFGQLGNPAAFSYVPVEVTGLGSGVQAVAVGQQHACALTRSGGVKCWGRNLEGESGNGTNSVMINPPVDVVGLANGVVSITVGGLQSCALTNVGGVKCWGSNLFGQLGDGSTVDRSTPVSVVGLDTGVIAVSAGGGHACAVTSSGAVKCWGYNASGQLGSGGLGNSSTPRQVSDLVAGVQTVSAGGAHTCALTNGGALKCWGANALGQLGNGTFIDSSTPVSVVGLAAAVLVASAPHVPTLRAWLTLLLAVLLVTTVFLGGLRRKPIAA